MRVREGLTRSKKSSVEKFGVCMAWSMQTNLAQKMASEAVKQQRGNTHSCRNCVMVRFFVTSAGNECTSVYNTQVQNHQYALL